MIKSRKLLSKFVSISLALLLIATLLPSVTPAHAAGSIVPGGKAVSGTLNKDSSFAEYTVSGMTVSDYWGIRLTVKIRDTNAYELWLDEATPNYTIPGIWDSHFTTEFYPSKDDQYLSYNSEGFVYETPMAKYPIEEYKYTLSIPEYMWEDMPAEATFEYSLELYYDLPSEPTPSPDPGPSSGVSFSDVSSGDWYYAAVSFAVNNGLFQGTSDTTFSPNATMTRGMFVTVLGRVAGVDVSKYRGSDFTDVSASDYYAPYIKWAESIGVAGGVGNGKFEPDKALRREDLATMLYRYVESIGGDVSIGDQTKFMSFPDSTYVADHALMPMIWAVNKGIINGIDGYLSAGLSATRAQVAQIFMNAYNIIAGGTP